MVTQYPQPIAPRVVDVQAEPDSIAARALQRVRHAWCAMHGHDNMMQFEKDRMFLQCVSCGHESPGWMLAEMTPPVRLRAETHRHPLVQTHVFDERRIA